MDSTSFTGVSHCCHIIPIHVLQAIANSNAASSNSRAIASKTILKIKAIHQAREDAQAKLAAGEPHAHQGIVPSYVFQAILDSDTASEQSKGQAKNCLAGIAALKAGKKPQTPGKPATSTPHLFRVIFDSHETDIERQKGTEVIIEGHVPENPDPSAKQVYDHFGSTFKFYSEVLGRNSLDNKGLNLLGNVHFDDDNGKTPGYDNAFWDDVGMAFGDGDSEIFNSFTLDLDVTAHELTHGVTHFTANLPYRFQSGALNESMSDVFGSMVKQYSLQQTAKQADWLVGQSLFRNPKARALRDLANPGTAYKNIPEIGSDPQPKDMDGWVNSSNDEDGDYGGVHVNSGIPNRAFHLAATAVGIYSWDPVGKIWYAALTDPALVHVNVKTAFKVFADLTVKHAKIIGGDAAVTAVTNAWRKVKVLSPASA